MGFPGVSDVDEAVALACRHRPFKTFRYSTVATLESIGISALPTFAVPHYTLELPGDLDDDLWEAIDAAFSSPIRLGKRN